jgi:hypothetical protein
MKRKIYAIVFLLLIFVVSGCVKKNEQREIKEGEYYYENKDLGFNLILGPEFIYYQTQRISTEDYIDIEIFVPTSDIDQQIELPGYAKPIVIRIFDKKYYEGKEEEKNLYEKVGENKDSIYGIRFWEKIPKDWEDKWNKDFKNSILNDFRLM